MPKNTKIARYSLKDIDVTTNRVNIFDLLNLPVAWNVNVSTNSRTDYIIIDLVYSNQNMRLYSQPVNNLKTWLKTEEGYDQLLLSGFGGIDGFIKSFNSDSDALSALITASLDCETDHCNLYKEDMNCLFPYPKEYRKMAALVGSRYFLASRNEPFIVVKDRHEHYVLTGKNIQAILSCNESGTLYMETLVKSTLDHNFICYLCKLIQSGSTDVTDQIDTVGPTGRGIKVIQKAPIKTGIE